MNDLVKMNPNPLVKYLDKLPKDFTKTDIMKYIEAHNVQMLNFRYVGGDGRIKMLNFVINNRKYLDEVLSCGERVDGSSLFSYVEAGSSDLYVIPRYRTAYLNPFTEFPTIDILCSYYDKDGNPLASSPEYILQKAHKSLQKSTGYSFEAMGELEFYLISEKNALFPATDQKGYHESMPFSKWGGFRSEAIQLIAQAGCTVKYSHSEVGNFSQNGTDYEQNEIEFLPADVECAADQLVIAKWILRSLAYKYGINLTFSPKITSGKAGSGLHIHTRLVRGSKNMFVEKNKLSDIAKKTIAGYLYLAPSLTAFGNTVPASYFRLVPHQEAPTNICWGDRNRSVLVRVPLGWTGNNNMIAGANPEEKAEKRIFSDKQTVEFRCPDGSADIYLLLAGLTVASRYGLEMKDALKYAKERYVDVNIFKDEHKIKQQKLSQLPVSCYESADFLERQMDIYTRHDVFPRGTIEEIIHRLKRYDDKDLRKKLEKDPEKMMEIVNKYIHHA